MNRPSTNKRIPFNWPYMTGKELYYIAEAHFNGCLAGDGPFSKRCHAWIENYVGCKKALLTHSCTAALEMTALLLDIMQGDEIIMPSYTFVSTANAFALRGGIPVFIDIREDTLNINEKLIEEAITNHTRAIVPVHYAGVACEMDTIMSIARNNNLKVVEDAAQGVMARYKGHSLGSIGDIGTFSFHETKNIISGEGGALLVNDFEFIRKAEIVREKGTDRSQFFRGEVDKYTWQDIGSSYLPGELIAAFLWAQLEEADRITKERLAIWNRYHTLFQQLEFKGYLRRPIVPVDCEHNAHMYYIILANKKDRPELIEHLRKNNIWSVFHYVPLHTSPAGKRYGKINGDLSQTENLADSLIRLPLFADMSESQQLKVVRIIESYFL